jgi:hypothetical protein
MKRSEVLATIWRLNELHSLVIRSGDEERTIARKKEVWRHLEVIEERIRHLRKRLGRVHQAAIEENPANWLFPELRRVRARRRRRASMS